MKDWFSIKLGRIIQSASKLYGGGSALPGLVLEKLNPDLMAESLQELPYGVVVVSGTNGKTTTTKALVEILKDQGLKVFTNDTGSNFIRGVASAWLSSVDSHGELSADIAVLELDEAHAVHFINQILPSYCLLLNVMRDQLDRFGELDHVAKLLSKIAEKTTKTVIFNSTDQRLVKIGGSLPAKNIRYFGASEEVLNQLANLDRQTLGQSTKNSVTIESFKNQQSTFSISKKSIFSIKTQLEGAHNQLNLAGAIATAQAILGNKLNTDRLIASLKNIQPAFGRGETFLVDGRQVKLLLVKNPAGFQSSLATLADKAPSLIAINDNYADGRDVSWLWDVDFSKTNLTQVYTTGSRSADMALRLKYDEISATGNQDLRLALKHFLQTTTGENVVIFATYTAMLKLRHDLLRLEKKHV